MALRSPARRLASSNWPLAMRGRTRAKKSTFARRWSNTFLLVDGRAGQVVIRTRANNPLSRPVLIPQIFIPNRKKKNAHKSPFVHTRVDGRTPQPRVPPHQLREININFEDCTFHRSDAVKLLCSARLHPIQYDCTLHLLYAACMHASTIYMLHLRRRV